MSCNDSTGIEALEGRRTSNSTNESQDVDFIFEDEDLQIRQSEPYDKRICTQSDVRSLGTNDFWTLLRRFNMQISHVKQIGERPPGYLDMNIAADEDITSDKLQAHAERLYIVVISVLVAIYKHIVRLRSWRERRRTLAFCSIYVGAWVANSLFPILILWVMLLLIYPPARDFCFPSAPTSIMNATTGGIQHPVAGVLASDSLTGAPEKHVGEALEQEARSFCNSILTLCIGIGSGEYSHEKRGEVFNGPKQIIQDIADAGAKSSEEGTNKNDDKTKEPVSRLVNNFQARPVLHILPDIIDTFERLANALSPTPPFPTNRPRLIMASCLIPSLVVSLLLSPYAVIKTFEFIIGFAIFGNPLISRTISLLNSAYPEWKTNLELQNTLLRGVPTNLQLTVTHLRMGESRNLPLPRPPASTGPPLVKASVEPHDLVHLGVSESDLRAAISPVSDEQFAKSANRSKEQENAPPSTATRVAGRIKKTAKSSVRAIHKISEVTKSIAHRSPRSQLCDDSVCDRSVKFPSVHKNEKGSAYITTVATTPGISWISDSADLSLSWIAAIADVQEVRKIDGTGRKRRALIDWALDKEVAGGIVLQTEQNGEILLTAVESRDALFNRIISIGSQMWEVR